MIIEEPIVWLNNQSETPRDYVKCQPGEYYFEDPTRAERAKCLKCAAGYVARTRMHARTLGCMHSRVDARYSENLANYLEEWAGKVFV